VKAAHLPLRETLFAIPTGEVVAFRRRRRKLPRRQARHQQQWWSHTRAADLGTGGWEPRSGCAGAQGEKITSKHTLDAQPGVHLPGVYKIGVCPDGRDIPR